MLTWLYDHPDVLEALIFAGMIFAIVCIAAFADSRGWKNYWDQDSNK